MDKFEFQSPTTFVDGYKSGMTSEAVRKKELFFYKDDEEIMRSLSSAKWLKYKSLGRNSICLCGSKRNLRVVI